MKKSKLLTLFVPLMLLSILGLSQGDPAPDVSAKNQDGKLIHLSDFKGHYILLYFYPKDETPGCTKEACTLRDSFDKIKALNTVIFGISRQDEKSHKEFIAKNKLPFDLLVDKDGSIGKEFGVGSIPLMGFSKRESFLIGPDGKVLKYYEKVNPSDHASEVITDLKALQK
jgi:peroxiredoxin Q/BCP